MRAVCTAKVVNRHIAALGVPIKEVSEFVLELGTVFDVSRSMLGFLFEFGILHM